MVINNNLGFLVSQKRILFSEVEKGTLWQKAFNGIQLIPYIKSACKLIFIKKMIIRKRRRTEALTT